MDRRSFLAASAAAAVFGANSSFAQGAEETIKMAVGQRGNWENAAPELGTRKGVFARHGLKLDVLYTQGGGETQQAVVSGSVDIGVGVGTGGVMGAFAKGAPIRAICNSTTGANDLYWYVPAGSPVKSFADLGGRTVAYSTNGSSTNLTALGLMKQFGVAAKPVATGNPASTFTQVMSGQVDAGWSSPPFGVEALKKGQIRIIARGSDVPSLQAQTVRVMITNLAFAEKRTDALRRFQRAYAETLAWMYADDAALEAYAEWVKVPVELARATRDEFFPAENLRLDRLSGVDAAMADAVASKFLPAPLTQAQQDELFKYYAKA